jgi:response regulator RpfG family c-di-GMP phosphodiesterase
LKRVLVVDDEPSIRKALRRELRAKFDVLEAANYDEALALLRSTPQIEAVISDVEMGHGPGGVELLGDIKKINPTAVRILLSARNEEFGQSHVRSGLAHYFIGKPWKLGEPTTAIEANLTPRAD